MLELPVRVAKCGTFSRRGMMRDSKSPRPPMRLRRARLILALSLPLLPQWSHAIDVTVPTRVTEVMLYADDPKEWLSIKLVVSPTYPPAHLAAGKTGHVDVQLRLDEFGKVVEVKKVEATPMDAAFEMAAREVLKFWLFKPPVSEQCVPIASDGNVRLWFEIRDGKPAISVSSLPDPTAKPREQAAWRPMINYRQMAASVRYPYAARRLDAQGDLFSIMTVDAGTGEVMDAEVSHAVVSHGNAKQHFRDEIVRALMRGRFEPRPAETGKRFKACIEFKFRLS